MYFIIFSGVFVPTYLLLFLSTFLIYVLYHFRPRPESTTVLLATLKSAWQFLRCQWIVESWVRNVPHGHQTKTLEVQATSFRSTFQASVDKIQCSHMWKDSKTFPNVLVHIFGVVCFVFKPFCQSQERRWTQPQRKVWTCGRCLAHFDTQRHGCNPSQNERSFYGLTCALISKNFACAGKVAGGLNAGFVRHRA